jgi:RNA polymerase sigma-70 factor (ECF subfamily)
MQGTAAPASWTDDELVAGLETDARLDCFDELLARYGRRVQHFVAGILRDQHLAQDVAQEVFEKLLAKSRLYQSGTNFRAWLFEVARNQALSVLRRRRRSPRALSSLGIDADGGGDPLSHLPARDEQALEEGELMSALAAAIADLPRTAREVFELCVQQGRTYQHAADRLGIPTGTVAIRIMRARRRLFRALSGHLGRIRRPPACFQ